MKRNTHTKTNKDLLERIRTARFQTPTELYLAMQKGSKLKYSNLKTK